MCQLFAVSSAAALRTSLSWEGFAMRGSAALGNPDGWGWRMRMAPKRTVPLDDQHWRPLAAGELLRIEHGILV